MDGLKLNGNDGKTRRISKIIAIFIFIFNSNFKQKGFRQHVLIKKICFPTMNYYYEKSHSKKKKKKDQIV